MYLSDCFNSLDPVLVRPRVSTNFYFSTTPCLRNQIPHWTRPLVARLNREDRGIAMSGECEYFVFNIGSVLIHPAAYRDTWDKPAEERKFLAKLDACVITYAALSYFSKYV